MKSFNRPLPNDKLQIITGGIPDAPGTPFENVLWYDDFNYIVNTVDPWVSLIDNPFVNQPGSPWTHAKDDRITTAARGLLSTVDPTTDIAGVSVNPTRNSSRVLRVEGRASEGQTDIFLQRGDGVLTDNDVLPADCWVQHWLMLHRAGTELSQFSNQGTKWIYPCRDSYPCTTMSNVLQLRGYAGGDTCASMPDQVSGWYPLDDGSENRPGNDQHSWTPDPGDPCYGDYNPIRRGVHNSANFFAPNTWYLTKFRLSTVGPNGSIELWVREYGNLTWSKWMDWRGNVTPDTYQYLVDAVNQGVGHQLLKLFTTFNDVNSWVYVGDFQVATSEANLENGYTN